jgi:5'-nucleotidase
MIILVDLDGVLADFETGFLNIWKKLYPDRIAVPVEERTTFYLEDQYPKEYFDDIKKIKGSSGFNRDLPVIPGAIEAIHEMSKNHDVFICTSPLTNYKNCIEGKYEWVERELGESFVKKLIVTKDKTLVKADVLIDDRPEVTGSAKPEWELILFNATYNINLKDKKRLDWSNWQDVIGTL